MKENKLFLYWLCAFILAAIVLANSNYKSRNDDSNYYTSLVVRYQNQDWKHILSPKWGENFYSYKPEEYMRDQFPGQLILGIAMTKIGIPAPQALHILGLFFQILSFYLLVKISAEFVPYSSVLYYGLILTPMSFSYNIRANHELGIMFFSFLALYSGIRLNLSKQYFAFSILSSLMLLIIKGPFFIFGIFLTLIGSLCGNKKSSILKLAILIVVSTLLVLLVSYGYEKIYFNITGESFFSEFYRIQIQKRAMQGLQAHSFIIQKFINFYYYFSHLIIYSLLWSLGLILLIALKVKNREFILSLKVFLKTRLSFCLFLSALIFCCIFSLSDRTATRYIFPAYYLFSAWVILLIYHLSDKFKYLHLKIEKNRFYIFVPILWLIPFALHFLTP